MKFVKNPKMNKQVEKKLKIVTKIIADELKPVSVLLFGSFGKGEGTVLNGKEVFNDFDMYIITKDKVKDSELDRVGRKASNAIGMGGGEFIETDGTNYDRKKFFHVDLRAITLKNLKSLRKTTRTFEIKYATQLLYGKDTRHLIKINEKELPTSEGWRYLINKSALLLLAMDSRRFSNHFNKDERLIAIYYCLKTFIDCSAAMLLLKKQYSGTYGGRNKLFKKLYGKEMPEIAKKLNWATNFKQDFRPDKIKNPIKLWKEARNFLKFTLKYMAEKDFGITASSLKELLSKLNRKMAFKYHVPYIPLGNITFPSQYLLNLLYFRKTGHLPVLFDWRDIGYRMMMPCLLLLYGIEDRSLLKEAKRYLWNMAPIKKDDFEGLRKAALYAYGNYYTQRLL
ncbi:MAG TPA: hypothetical protein VJB94_00395 [Candidatus Nanoarchaeia archaeon]|nr:hypothetical protein [Candidatus Nanoarchaeia archaeon]